MENHIKILIGQGTDIRLWLDNWHPRGVLIKQYGDRIRYDTGMDRLSSLNSILTNGVWHPPPATSMDLMEAWSDLHSLEMLRPTDKDTAVWTATPNGVFTTSSAWRVIRDRGQIVDWHKVVWCTNYIPKHSVLAWRVMMKRLPTQSRLCKLKVLTNSQCVFCWNNRESLDHLYFQCSFTRSIWENILRRLHPLRK